MNISDAQTHGSIQIPYSSENGLLELSDPVWSVTQPVRIERYWSGDSAPPERHAEARLFWTSDALYVRFDASQAEPLIVSGEPRLDKKTLGLWDRDVCEIFIAPDVSRPERYFEFEAAPTGEWVDLAIELTPQVRKTDTEYRSGMLCVAEISEGRILIGMRLPWDAFGMCPKPEDVWLGNLFRCIGQGVTRGYLAWRPTMTEVPNFHVPSAFGRLIFRG